MNFNRYLDLAGKHALLSASNFHWIRYSEDRLEEYYQTCAAAELGTKLHELAKDLITLGVKLPNVNETLNMYVNDAIDLGMTPEVVLYYSPNCFGTADAILFNEETKFLHIHDLKTGKHPASMDQLMVYAALFCLEYNYNPYDIHIELRIYQMGDIRTVHPTGDDVEFVMNRIVVGDDQINKLKEGRDWRGLQLA